MRTHLQKLSTPAKSFKHLCNTMAIQTAELARQRLPLQLTCRMEQRGLPQQAGAGVQRPPRRCRNPSGPPGFLRLGFPA